jgi:hypothetical protein
MAAIVATIDDLRSSISGRSLEAEVRTLSSGSAELLVSQPQAWLQDAVEKLSAFVALPQNWDSHGSSQISVATANHASQLLTTLCDLGLPAPRLVPTSSGGVQLEWHDDGVDLELELFPDGRIIAVFDDTQSSESWEQELPQNDLIPIEAALRRIIDAGRR